MALHTPTYPHLQNNATRARNWWKRIALPGAGAPGPAGDVQIVRLPVGNKECPVLDGFMFSGYSAADIAVEIGAFDGVNFTSISGDISFCTGAETHGGVGGIVYADDQWALNAPIIPGVALAVRVTSVFGTTLTNGTVLMWGHFEFMSDTKLRNLRYFG